MDEELSPSGRFTAGPLDRKDDRLRRKTIEEILRVTIDEAEDESYTADQLRPDYNDQIFESLSHSLSNNPRH